jgi:hypothetical protein
LCSHGRCARASISAHFSGYFGLATALTICASKHL